MIPLLKNRSKKAGLPPGVILPGEAKAPVHISLISYDASSFTEKTLSGMKESIIPLSQKGVNWIHVQGVHDTAMIEDLGERFRLNRLVIEDIVTPGQRPKVEIYEDYVFIIFRSLNFNEEKKCTEDEQMSLIIQGNTLISFQEKKTPLFDGMRERLRQGGKGGAKRQGADYLAYTIMDIVVDNYFVVLEKMGDLLAQTEETVVHGRNVATNEQIHQLRRDLIFIRRSVWPLREVISRLLRQESEHFTQGTLFYLRDVYDHTIQVVDTIEMFRDLITSMLDIYRSGMTQRLNEVMKVLTIVSTIFCPLTFIAGVFGMNFVNLPGLQWQNGYYMTLGLMGVVALFMIFYFKHKKWI